MILAKAVGADVPDRLCSYFPKIKELLQGLKIRFDL